MVIQLFEIESESVPWMELWLFAHWFIQQRSHKQAQRTNAIKLLSLNRYFIRSFLIIYFSQITMQIKFWQQHCNVCKPLNTLHPGGIRSRDLRFCRRTRWPLCQAARAIRCFFITIIFWSQAAWSYGLVCHRGDWGLRVVRSNPARDAGLPDGIF
jgi:hypothetical protein